MPFPLKPIYCATKAAVHSYPQSLRVQLSRTRGRVFEVAPPGTNGTEFNATNDFAPGELNTSMLMDLTKMVRASLRGIERDREEIFPGPSKLIRLIARVAPRMTVMSKPAAALTPPTAPQLSPRQP